MVMVVLVVVCVFEAFDVLDEDVCSCHEIAKSYGDVGENESLGESHGFKDEPANDGGGIFDGLEQSLLCTPQIGLADA